MHECSKSSASLLTYSKHYKAINMLTLDKIYHASYVLKDVIRRTELVPAPNVNKKGTIFLKPENLQLTGSFKVRGSYYKISQLSDEE